MERFLRGIKQNDLNDILIRLIVLFPITTLFQKHVSFSNIMLLAVITFVLFVKILYSGRVKVKYFLLVFYSIAIWIIAVLNTSIPALKTNKNMAIYYLFMIIYFVFFIIESENIWVILNRSKNYIFCVVCSFTLLLTISIFLPSSYVEMTAGGWGSDKYFVSFSGSPNRVGPACLFILVLMIFLVQNNCKRRLNIIMILPHLYTVAMGGSRTYFILCSCAVLILLYYGVPNKKMFKYLLPLIMLMTLVVIIKSNMLNKIIATFQYSDEPIVFWQKLTNTRSIFWVEQLKLFWNTSKLHHLIGNGINFTTYNYGLWAHSDFIEILCSYGYIGLINYIFMMMTMLKVFWKDYKASGLIKFVVFFIWFFNAFFNFFFCYFCAMMCYPFLLLVISKEKDINSKREQIDNDKGICCYSDV